MENKDISLLFEEEKDKAPLFSLLESESVGEVGEEFSLPDYVPEVRRILTVRASVLPESKYLNDTGSPIFLELGGTVAYSVIYLDREENVCALPLSSTYFCKANLSESPKSTDVQTLVDSVSCRVLGPRRLNIKTRLKNKILSLKEIECEPKIFPLSSGEEIYEERKYEEISTFESKKIALDNVKISDKLEIGEGMRPIWCDAQIDISEVCIKDGEVLVRGEVSVKCLAVNGSETEVYEKTVKLSEGIGVEDLYLGGSVRVFGRCVSLSLSNEEADGSSDVFFDLTLELLGEVIKAVKTKALVDAYSTMYPSKEEYKEIEYFTAERVGTGNFSISEQVKSEGLKNREIITVFAAPVYEKCEIKGQKAYLVGKITLGVITRPDDPQKEIQFDSFDFPIKYEVPLENSFKNPLSRNEFSLGKISATLDSGKLNFNGEILAAYAIYERKNKRVLESSEIKTDEKIKRDNATLRVCFPKKGQSLWDLGKRYHTSLARLSAQNEIDRDAPLEKTFLII